jgi:hypothetical protein
MALEHEGYACASKPPYAGSSPAKATKKLEIVMSVIKTRIVDLYYIVSYKIKQKIFLLKSGDKYKKDFELSLYHDRLMEVTIAHCDSMSDYDPKDDDNWYVGSIPKDWEERIDMKIAQKNKEAEKE